MKAELHIYANAGHSFGYRPDTTTAAGAWPFRFREWIEDSGLLKQGSRLAEFRMPRRPRFKRGQQLDGDAGGHRKLGWGFEIAAVRSPFLSARQTFPYRQLALHATRASITCQRR